MHLTCDGIVLSLRKIEDDRILTMLTKNRGVLTAFANGANKMRSRLASSTELLCYSRFVFFEHKGKYVVDSADVNRVFFGIRSDLTKLSLATYFAQLSAELSPKEEAADLYLSLLLNTLHLLEEDKRPQLQLKSAFTLRMLTLAGFMPNLVACRSCGSYGADRMLFFPLQGDLLCGDCATGGEVGYAVLPPGVLTGMRHIIYSDAKKLFAFSLSDNGLKLLDSVVESYLKHQVEKTLDTLEFYTGLMTCEPGNSV